MTYDRPSTNNVHPEPFKLCVDKVCNNKGLYPLKIVYFNKIGYFCKEHKDEFLSLGLVEVVDIEDPQHNIPKKERFKPQFHSAFDLLDLQGGAISQ